MIATIKIVWTTNGYQAGRKQAATAITQTAHKAGTLLILITNTLLINIHLLLHVYFVESLFTCILSTFKVIMTAHS